MHIPDGFLNPAVSVSTTAISAAILAGSLRKVNQQVEPQQIPLMGVLASFVFLIQLFSFPVGAGTSVHLSGALLISIILGPLSGFIIITIALIAMALLFQHGGIFSLGANALNIAGVGCFLGYGTYRLIPGDRVSIVIAGLITGLVSSALLALELYASDMLDLSAGLLSMLSIYGSAGLIEGLATLMIVLFIRKVKPEIMGSMV
ncbi:MAG: energy-coupling factor ABC transporter permease [Candidatus Marinimicrobia bacterium]|nr:energy-coupling factor ABC transporter permease [Candidatus Neomarinimicrobiota bacterium]MCF7851357.1 energy-coupling factor ABC transporter permease [Candidatus Neomarinimicrobiota bacterium]MCF7905165.1 energy-coupling factor ABC transporter permease [Candidatus Neomarinimicrobiota bacterium]